MTEYPEGWEEWFAFLSAQLPDPLQREVAPSGVTFFTAGEPPEVMVRLSASSITVSTFTWDEGGPLLRPMRLGTIMWRRLLSGKAMALVAGLIGSAREMRLTTYRRCYRCEKVKPPEQMHEEDICLECAKAS